jgi:hypothetical protein
MPLPLFKLGLAAAAGYFLFKQHRRSQRAGSPTNASDAMDDVQLGAHPTDEDIIDAGVKETFPASDPIAVDRVETAYEKQLRQQSPQSGSGS